MEEKKESWIETLIELLNEYEKTLEPNLQIEWTEVWIKSTPEIVISKKFWFIQRLVENKKINVHGIPEFYHISDHSLEECYRDISDNVIMLLSIQDEPISFLLSLLR